MKALKKVGAGVGLAGLSGLAAAQSSGGIDTTAVLAGISSMQTAIVAVGGAIIVVAAIAVGYKWVKGMLFG